MHLLSSLVSRDAGWSSLRSAIHRLAVLTTASASPAGDLINQAARRVLTTVHGKQSFRRGSDDFVSRREEQESTGEM